MITTITRENIDTLIDARRIEYNVRIPKGTWWTIRRNGKTWLGTRERHRIRLPFKAGISVYSAITEDHFLSDGQLNPELFRLKK